MPPAVFVALAFAAALFVAGWISADRLRHERRPLRAAAVRILVACLAFGLAPMAIVSLMSGATPSALRMTDEALPTLLSIVCASMPPALLLVHAAAPRSAPRGGSLLADIDRAEEALAVLAAVLLLPWWRSLHPRDTALLLFLLALPAVAIGLHALVLIRRVRLFDFTAQAVPVVGAESAVLSWDLGVGGGHRAIRFDARTPYRTAGSAGSAVLQGDPEQAEGAAKQVLLCSAATCALATIHGVATLLSASG
ncbi:MAG: hypothetical protein QM820_63725 [Minicystis sp.]